VTVLIFTSDFRLALGMGLEVAVIANGKLMLQAPASQIAELPQHDTVRHLIGGERLRARTLMRPPIGEPILELDGVTKTYRRGLPRFGPPPVEALNGIGFAVRQGEAVGILGPAGAGKSTLLRLIAGLERPTGGQLRRRQGLVGYVFSDPRRAFNPTLPVGMSLTEPLRVEQTLLVEEQADRLVEVGRAVGLQPQLLNRLPGDFAVAELQRLALARALAGRPNLLLLDEPTACLDPPDAREFLTFLARVRADFGVTAIIASREFEVLQPVADRLLVLDGGHIVEVGKPAELADAPKQEVTRRLVSPRYPPELRHVDERVLNSPQPAPLPSGDGPDETAIGGEAQDAVDGLVDATGRTDAPGTQAGR
jgi:ABC-type glutathione transport system ATPase component